MLKYIELKTGYHDNGPAWIGRVSESKTRRTVYFNGRALQRLPGGGIVGNYIDIETREEFWVSGLKKKGADRHWAGSGRILVERGAVSEYLELIGATRLDPSRYEVTDDVVATDIEKFKRLKNEKLDPPSRRSRLRHGSS